MNETRTPETTAITTTPETTAVVQISPETEALVKQEMPDKPEEAQRETMALIEAIKRRAQLSVQEARDVTLDSYLKAVQQAREAVEQNKPLIDPVQVEKSVELVQRQAEMNWSVIVSEIESLGVQLVDAARDAWNMLMHPDQRH
jgi:vacuolar-type H+-ATPase subunit E/Vma4